MTYRSRPAGRSGIPPTARTAFRRLTVTFCQTAATPLYRLRNRFPAHEKRAETAGTWDGDVQTVYLPFCVKCCERTCCGMLCRKIQTSAWQNSHSWNARYTILACKIVNLGLQDSQSWLAKQTVLGCKKDCFGVQKRQNKGKKRKKRGSERLNPAFSVC